MEKFHEYHIPEGIMEIKVEEFRSLTQGPMMVNQYIWKFTKLAWYAPEDVNSNKKKHKCFRRGLNTSLWEKMATHIYPDFNTLTNYTILFEEERERWRRTEAQISDAMCLLARKNTMSLHQQHRTHKVPTNYAVQDT